MDKNLRFKLIDAITGYIEGQQGLQTILDLTKEIKDPEVLGVILKMNNNIRESLTTLLEKLID